MTTKNLSHLIGGHFTSLLRDWLRDAAFAASDLIRVLDECPRLARLFPAVSDSTDETMRWYVAAVLLWVTGKLQHYNVHSYVHRVSS